MLDFFKEYKDESFSIFAFLFLSIAIFVLFYLYLNEYVFYIYLAITYGTFLFFLFLRIIIPSHRINTSITDVLMYISFIIFSPISVPFFFLFNYI